MERPRIKPAASIYALIECPEIIKTLVDICLITNTLCGYELVDILANAIEKFFSHA